ncbi:MAG: SDR family NAD(P)-dependent oxidoreductase [Paracoccaceae bacterium]
MTAIEDRLVVITGASRGIGAAAARVFADAGAKVALLARDTTALGKTARMIGADALAIAADVTDPGAVSRAVATAEARFGPTAVLINNAGVIEPIALMAAADPKEWSRAIDINLKGVFHGMRAVLPGMMARRAGTILTVSSGAAHNALEGWSAYCAAKAGAAMLTRSAHLEAGSRGIRVMGLSPGTVATDMQTKVRASRINPVSQLDPSAHIPADWAAKALLWMCTPDADAFLGQEVALRDDAIRRRIGLVA